MVICLHPTETKHTVESGFYRLGARALHTDGISSVEFTADDGSSTPVSTNVLSESNYNKHPLPMWRHNAVLDLSSLNDGQVTITIKAYAADATTLSESYSILNNSGGSFTQVAVYMDSSPTGS